MRGELREADHVDDQAKNCVEVEEDQTYCNKMHIKLLREHKLSNKMLIWETKRYDLMVRCLRAKSVGDPSASASKYLTVRLDRACR